MSEGIYFKEISMKKVKFAIVACLLVSGCAKEPPKCSDEETFSLIRQIIIEKVGGEKGITGEEIKNNMKIELPRASAFDEKIKKYSCEAKLIAGGTIELPITYESQLDDNNQHIVSVGGISNGDLRSVAYAIAQGIAADREKMNSAPKAASEIPAKEPVDNETNIAATNSLENTLCKDGESVSFSCVSDKGVTYSLCASKKLSQSYGYMQLHFKSDKGEGVIPEQQRPPAEFATGDTLAFSGGGGAYMRIKNSESANYIVYSAMGKGFDKQGVAVELNGKVVLNNTCENISVNEIGPSLFEKYFIQKDNDGFEIPFDEPKIAAPENGQIEEKPSVENEAEQKTWTPSFDCGKASTFVEKSICSVNVLGNLDGAMAENYKYMKASDIGDGAKSDLTSTQKQWMLERNKCTSIECVETAYRKRIDEICEYPVISGVHPACTMSDEIK